MIVILQRELSGILRTPRAVAAICVSAALFALLVLARWPTSALVDLSGAQSRLVFRVFAYGLLGGVLLLVPAFPAVSVVRERIQGTLLLLLNSPLKPGEIYLGKVLGVVGFAVLLLATSLPAATACYAMGGVDLLRDIGSLYLVLGLVMLECVLVGLYVSCHAQTPDSSVRVTYAAVFALVFATLGPNYLMQGKDGYLARGASLLRGLSPVPTVMEIVGDAGVGAQGLLEKRKGPEGFAFGAILVSALLAAGTLAQLNHRMFDRSRAQGKVTDDRGLAVRTARRMVFLVDPQRRKPGIPFYMNPVMVKEFRTRRFGRFHWLLRLIAACAVISLLMTLAATTGTVDWGVETMGGLMVLLQVVLVVLITPSLAAPLVSSEIESGGWSLLQTTSIAGWRIVTGKLASVLWTMLLVLMATVPGYLIMIWIEPSMWLQIYVVQICLLLTVVYTLSVSSAVGCWMSRTAAATVVTYVVLMAIFLGPLLIWLGRDAPFGRPVVEAALMINPLGAALSVIGMPGFAQYELLPASWWIAGVVSVCCLLGFVVRVRRLLKPL